MELAKRPSAKAETGKQLIDSEIFFRKIALFLNLLALAGIFYLIAKLIGRNARLVFSDELIILLALMLVLLVNAALFAAMRKIEHQIETADCDELTEVLNRNAFERIMQKEIRRAGRYRYPLALCLIDLDDFRSFNESYGKGRADMLLKSFASFLSRTSRGADYFGRYDSDEFCILLPHTDIVQAEKFISRALAQTQEQLDCSFSAGITAYHTGETRAQFLIRAGVALQQAKREGKKKIRCIIGGNDGHNMLSF